MKIKYVHFSESDKEKIFDTEKAYKKRPLINILTGLFDEKVLKQTQEEYDKQELEHMEKDRKKGYILSYEVLGGR